MSTPKSPKLVEVTLTKAHTHAGTAYKPGAKIRVTEHQRAFLAERQKIEVPDTEAKAAAKSTAKS